MDINNTLRSVAAQFEKEQVTVDKMIAHLILADLDESDIPQNEEQVINFTSAKELYSFRKLRWSISKLVLFSSLRR